MISLHKCMTLHMHIPVHGGPLEHTIYEITLQYWGRPEVPSLPGPARQLHVLGGLRIASSPTTIIVVSYGNKKEKKEENKA